MITLKLSQVMDWTLEFVYAVLHVAVSQCHTYHGFIIHIFFLLDWIGRLALLYCSFKLYSIEKMDKYMPIADKRQKGHLSNDEIAVGSSYCPISPSACWMWFSMLYYIIAPIYRFYTYPDIFKVGHIFSITSAVYEL